MLLIYLITKLDITERDLGMKHVKSLFCYLIGGIVWFGQAVAGTDPISWTLDQTFPHQVIAGTAYSATYTLTNTLPIQLMNPLIIKYNASPANEFTYTDGCTGQRLKPNQRCKVAIYLMPVAAGEKRIQISIEGYDKNVVPLPQLVTSSGSSPDVPPFAPRVSGIVTVPLPGSIASADIDIPFMFTFTNSSNTAATNLVTTVTTTIGSTHIITNDTCSGMTLSQSSGPCTVSGTFNSAITPALQAVTANLSYGGVSGSPTTVSTSTAVSTSSKFFGVAQPGLSPLLTPSTTYHGTGIAPYFLFTNNTGSPATLTQATSLNLQCSASDGSSCSGLLSSFSTSCNAGNLPNKAQCYITANFTTPVFTTLITYTLTATVDYNGGSTAAAITSGSMVTQALPSSRIVQLVNNCPFALSYSLHGGALGGVPASCPQGSVRYTDGNCYWNNYVGKSNILLAGATDRVTIPGYSYIYQNNPIQWSGNISASVGCAQPNGGSCTQVTCSGDNGGTSSCAVGQGFTQPATQAEITMQANAQADSYDVEVINGFHIPISMTPFYYISSDGATKIPAVANNYNCGVPGNYFTGGGLSNGFGSCDWNEATPPTPAGYYYNITGGSGTPCVATSPSCPAKEVCGVNASLQQVCGNFIGYWTPDQLCGQSFASPAPSYPFYTGLSCATPTNYGIPGDKYNNTYTSLMTCSKPIDGNPAYNTCYGSYSTGTPGTCCGCVDWWQEPASIPGVNQNGGPGILVTSCPSGYSSTDWETNIQKGVQWLKKACPSGYVYPFDDQTSSFKCTNSTTQPNTTSYVVTFCPGGKTGLPTGLTDGRG